MIKFKRSPEIPPSLLDEQARTAQEKANEFFARPIEDRGTERFSFDTNPWSRMKPDLNRAFYGKCAFLDRGGIQIILYLCDMLCFRIGI